MAWDITVPAGSDAIANGDNVIRTFKTDLQAAFRGQTTDGLIASFPGASAAAPIYAYRGAIGSTASRPAASADVGLYHNTTLNTIQRCNGSAYVDVATLIPSGTKMAFYQASPPTGWTAVAVNDKFMRVVTSGGTGGTTGGTVAASTSLAHTHTVASHTHTISSDGDHTHVVSEVPPGGADYGISHQYSSMTTAGAHTHSGATGAATPATDSQFAGAFAYADFCVGTKD